jgi:tape measure domain-containing protein
MEGQQINISTKEAIEELKRLQTEIQKTGDVLVKTGDEVEGAFKIGAAEGLARALDDLQKEFAQLKRSADILKAALRNTTDPNAIRIYKDNIAQLEAGMRKLSSTAKVAGVDLKKASAEAGTGTQVFENFFGAFTKVALITAAIQAVVKFADAAVKISQQTELATKQFAAFIGNVESATEAVGQLQAFAAEKVLDTESVFSAGKALLAFGESTDNIVPVLGRIADISAATGKNFNELVTIYGKARAAGVLYAEDINQLVDAGIPIIKEFARQMGVGADEVKKLASEGRITFEELQLAFFNLTAEGGKFADQSKINAQTVSGAWQGVLNDLRPAFEAVGNFLSDLTQKILFNLRAQIAGLKELLGVGAEKQGAFFDIEIDPEKVAKDAADATKRAEEATRKELEKAAAEARKRRALSAAKDVADLEKERQKAIIDGMEEGLEKEIAIENFRFSELEKRLKKFNLSTEEAERQHLKNIEQIRQDFADEEREKREAELKVIADAIAARVELELKLEKEAEKKTVEGIENARAIREELFKQDEAALQKRVQQRRAAGDDEKEIQKDIAAFELILQQARLRAEINFQEQFLAALGAGNDERKALLAAQIETLKAQLENIDLQIATPEGKKPFDLLEFFGIAPDDQDEFKKAVGQIINGIEAITESRVRAAEAAVDAAQAQVEASKDAVEQAEDALERELELAATGEASNVALRQAELDAAKRQAEEAKKIRDAALKEQQKAARAQLIVDSATQASSIVTATANLFASGSKFGFVGIALAVAQVASMIALFASIKARAKALTVQKFRKGGEVQGGEIHGMPHEAGGVPIEAEGGEFIVKKSETARHKTLLQAVNAGDTPRMVAYLERLGGARRDIEATNSAATAGDIVVNVKNTADAKVRALLWENNKLQKRILELEKGKMSVSDMGSHFLITKKFKQERRRK